MPTFAFPDAPRGLAAPLPRCPECSPTDITISRVFGGPLHARSLSIPARSTGELLRTL